MGKTHAIWRCGRSTVRDRRTGTRRVGCNYYNVYISRTKSKRSVVDPYKGVKSTSKTSAYSRSCKGSGFGRYRPRKVDTECRHCGARARFQLSEKRGDGRGRPRRVSVNLSAIHPADWDKMVATTKPGARQIWPSPRPLNEFTLKELIETAERMNRAQYEENLQTGFVPAKIYRREGE